MTESFLIAHRVRGEPAFDIAHQMECPHCMGKDLDIYACIECDQLGYWWIVSTSGHRAYPWYAVELKYLHLTTSNVAVTDVKVQDLDITSYPDHYPTRAAPTLSLAEALGFTNKPKPKDTSRPFPRRL